LSRQKPSTLWESSAAKAWPNIKQEKQNWLANKSESHSLISIFENRPVTEDEGLGAKTPLPARLERDGDVGDVASLRPWSWAEEAVPAGLEASLIATITKKQKALL
jgi:hypothetical protein